MCYQSASPNARLIVHPVTTVNSCAHRKVICSYLYSRVYVYLIAGDRSANCSRIVFLPFFNQLKIKANAKTTYVRYTTATDSNIISDSSIYTRVHEIMLRSSKYVLGLVVFMIFSLLALYSFSSLPLLADNNLTKFHYNYKTDSAIITEKDETGFVPGDWRGLTVAQSSRMSALGKWLLSPEGTNISKHHDDPSKEYLILIWKYGPMLERRHLKHFSEETFSPWTNCSVKNCRLSYESSDLDKADAILFHLHRLQGVKDLPKDLKFEDRVKQRWVFLTDESPYHTFLTAKQKLSNYNGLFNWSMTYRMDSDVPVPYGRTVAIKNGNKTAENMIDNLVKLKTKLVAIMGSNCGGKNHRWDYVRKLEEILGEKLDIYGHCLGGDTKSCPGHFTKDCELLGDYKFYLAFENSNCEEYLTEKPFWHGYQKHSVPIIMGASKANCRQLLPPKSFIHIDDFANPNTLADYLLYLDKNDNEYMGFHEWRKSFKVLNEHGYFQSTSRHYCRLCEALNYNEPSARVYDDLEQFWSVNRDCR